MSNENMTPEEVVAVEKFAAELETEQHEATSVPQEEPEAPQAPNVETEPAVEEPATPAGTPEAPEAEAAEPVVEPEAAPQSARSDELIQHPNGSFEVRVLDPIRNAEE